MSLEKQLELIEERIRARALSGKGETPESSQADALLPERYPNQDFFIADLLDANPRDDLGSMSHPIFSLSTKPDTRIHEYHYGGVDITVTPSVKGRATIKDKDVLLFTISQLVEAVEQGREDLSPTVRFTAYDLLVTTNRGTGGREYALLEGALERLSGTRIKTNIKVGGQRIREGFGLIESWKVVERAPNDNRMVSIEITLPKWLFQAIKAREVLALNRDYFRLRKPLDRRLYELARKHCGRQPSWRVSVPVLHRKAGSSANLREFRRMVGITAKSNHLPDYTVTIDPEGMVVFSRRTAVLECQGE